MGIQVDRDDPTNHHPHYLPCDETHLDVITLVLDHICFENKDIVLPPPVVSAYGGFATPWTYERATVIEYMERLREWIICGPESFIGAFCLMKRLEHLGAVPPCLQLTVHRVFLTCLVLAVKFMEDETLSNTDFAKVGCVTVAELNRMELDALKALEFDCTIEEEEYEACIASLRKLESKIKRRTLPGRSTDVPLSLAKVTEVPPPKSIRNRLAQFTRSLRIRSNKMDTSVDASNTLQVSPVKTKTKSLRFFRRSQRLDDPAKGESRKYETVTNKKARANQPVFMIRQDSAA